MLYRGRIKAQLLPNLIFFYPVSFPRSQKWAIFRESQVMYITKILLIILVTKFHLKCNRRRRILIPKHRKASSAYILNNALLQSGTNVLRTFSTYFSEDQILTFVERCRRRRNQCPWIKYYSRQQPRGPYPHGRAEEIHYWFCLCGSPEIRPKVRNGAGPRKREEGARMFTSFVPCRLVPKNYMVFKFLYAPMFIMNLWKWVN